MTGVEKARVASNATRAAKAQVRRDIRSGMLPIAHALLDPPDELRGDLLADVLLLAPMIGKGRLELIGRAAAAAEINLTVTLGRATVATREWLVDRIAEGVRPSDVRLPFEDRIEIEQSAGALSEEAMAAECVVKAILEHRRRIRSVNAPAEAFATADDWLWGKAEKIAEAIA